MSVSVCLFVWLAVWSAISPAESVLLTGATAATASVGAVALGATAATASGGAVALPTHTVSSWTVPTWLSVCLSFVLSVSVSAACLRV